MKLSKSELSALVNVRAGRPYAGCSASIPLMCRRNTILFRLRKAGLVRNVTWQWLITADGKAEMCRLDAREAKPCTD